MRLGIAVLLSLSTLAGCAAYRFGAETLFPPDIHTVYVPVFETDSFRRNLGERLTEAVVKEIERRTNYKVVGTAQADSILSGRITSDTKKVIVEDRNDQPRESELNLVVVVSWVRRGELIIDQAAVPIPQALEINQSGVLVPEYGQSVTTAQQQALVRLARQIVALMESSW